MFLTGTMLVSVGCKNYDDDINDLRGQIDNLEKGKISSVEEQIAAIKASITSLDAAYKAADAELKKGLEKQASDLAAAKTALEASIKALKTAHDADIAKLTSDLTALGTKVEGYNTALKASIDAVVKDLANNHYTKTIIDQKLAALDSKFAGEIAALKTKIDACNEAINAIKEQIKTMTEQINGKVNQADYDAFTMATNESLRKNAEAISVLQALCAGFPEGETIKSYIDAAVRDLTSTFADFQTTYTKFIEEYGAFKLDVETRISSNEAAIQTLEDWKTTLVGEGGTLALLETALRNAINTKTTLDEVKATYKASCAEFAAGVTEVINAALANGGAIDQLLTTKINTLTTTFQDKIDALTLRIQALEGAIGKLAGRIQSLVFVPQYTDGAIGFGAPHIGTGSNKIELTETALTTATFRVTPASLADALVAAFNATPKTVMMTIIDEELETRAVEPKIEIVGATAGEGGKINLVLTTEYDFTKDLAVALNIADISAEGDMQGIEFNSAYVPVLSEGEQNVSANFTIAKMVDGEYVAVTIDNNNQTLPYNSTATINIFDNISMVYNMGGDLISMADAAAKFNWDVTPTLKTTTTDFTNFTTAANYTVTPTDPKSATNVNKPVSVKIAANKAGVVGEVLSLTTTYSATAGTGAAAKNVAILSSAVSKVTITKAILSEIAVNATYNWKYAAYAANSYVSGDVIIPAGKLTAAQFNAIDWANAAWTVVKPANSPVVGTITVAAAKISTPSVDGDSQIINLTTEGYKNGSGSVALEALVDIGSDAQVKVTGTLTFNGLPDMAYAINVPAPVDYAIGATTVDVEVTKVLNTKLFTALAAGQKYFATQAEFDAFLATLAVKEAAQAAVVATNVPAANLVATADNKTLTVAFTKADIDFNKADTYTYTAPATARLSILDNTVEFFKVAVSGSVTINKSNGYYLGQGTSLIPVAGGTPYMLAKGAANVTNSTFTVANVLLSTGYGPISPAGSTGVVVVTYSLMTTQPAGYAGTLPKIDSATSGVVGVLDWNGCQLDKVAVKAVMTVDGLTVDTKNYEVQLQKPIDFAAWKVFPTKAVTVDLTASTVNTFDIMKGVGTTTPGYSRDIFGNVIVDATAVSPWAVAADAYGLAVEFGDATYSSSAGAVTFDRFEFVKATGILNIKTDNAELQGTVTVTVPVTFTYNYALQAGAVAPFTYTNVKFVKNVTITVTKK